MKQRTFTWYLEPGDNHTNKVISETAGIDAENFHERITCADGRPHSLWECPAQLMYAFLGSVRDLNLKFRIWGKEGKGKIYEKTGVIKAKMTRLKTLRKIS